MAFFAGMTVFVLAWSLMPGLGKILVAASTASTLSDEYALTGNGEIGNRCASLIVKSDRTQRNLQDHVLAGMASAVGAFAVTAAVGFEFAIVAVTQQRVVVGIRFEINAAAVPAIAPRWPASWDVLLPSKGNATVAAVARFDQNFCFVSKH